MKAIWEMVPNAIDLSDDEDLSKVAIFGAIDLNRIAAKVSDVFREKLDRALAR